MWFLYPLFWRKFLLLAHRQYSKCQTLTLLDVTAHCWPYTTLEWGDSSVVQFKILPLTGSVCTEMPLHGPLQIQWGKMEGVFLSSCYLCTGISLNHYNGFMTQVLLLSLLQIRKSGLRELKWLASSLHNRVNTWTSADYSLLQVCESGLWVRTRQCFRLPLLSSLLPESPLDCCLH